MESILFTHQQMLYLLNLERFKIYTKIHTGVAPTCFGLRPSSGSLYWDWQSYIKTLGKIMSL
jgi:hypothetical protein